MDRKRILIIVLVIALIAALAGFFVFTKIIGGSRDNETEVSDPNDLTESDDFELEEREEGNGIYFDEESDGASVAIVERDPSDYFGEWEATSDQGLYLYGSVDITVNEDGTWKGEITGEPLGGTWEQQGDHLHMNDTVAELFSFDLAFSESGNLMMIDTDSDDVINTVLTRKK